MLEDSIKNYLKKPAAAISTGPKTHLDHLAPLCETLNIPLIVTEEEHLEIGKEFYPMVEMLCIPLEQLTLEYIAQNFATLIECGKFWALELKPLIKLLYNKDLNIIFAPHGNSDKEALLQAPIPQDIALVYGPQMHREQKANTLIEMGNIRHTFYEAHKAHFDALAKTQIFAKCDPKKKTILYAPTWSTKATKTTFFFHIDTIIESLANDYNLLIKLHPLLEENHPGQFYHILGKYEERAQFILDFPAIYPILEKTDIYLGDSSSIGYDFLYYNRPMFFFKKEGDLTNCGYIFDPKKGIEDVQEELASGRLALYADAFGENKEALQRK